MCKFISGEYPARASADNNNVVIHSFFSPNGIKITGKSNHFIARVIGSEAQRRNGVKIDDVYQALTNQQATVFSIRTDANLERSQKFRFNNVDVTVNPDTGNLIQTNPHALKEKKKQ